MRAVAITMRSYNTRTMRSTWTLLTFAVLTLVGGTANAVNLEQKFRVEQPQFLYESNLRVVQANGPSLAQAIESVRRRSGGKVISAQTKVQDGREVHHIKVLKDGKVKSYTVKGRQRR